MESTLHENEVSYSVDFQIAAHYIKGPEQEPTKVTLQPPNIGVCAKCVSEDADHSSL